jgi:hypothetical protein
MKEIIFLSILLSSFSTFAINENQERIRFLIATEFALKKSQGDYTVLSIERKFDCGDKGTVYQVFYGIDMNDNGDFTKAGREHLIIKNRKDKSVGPEIMDECP